MSEPIADGEKHVEATTSDAVADAAAAADAAADEQKQRDELDTFVKDLVAKIELKTRQRYDNINCTRPNEDFYTKLDSSLKKNTAFVKKLKQFTATQLDSLLKDMATLNLTKYISEVSSALSEAKLKLTDVSAAIVLCNHLHRIYADFAPAFYENWQKLLCVKPNEKVQNASKLRVDLKFFAELISVGIFSNKMGLPLLGQTLTMLIAQDKDEFNNLSIILSFCRHCGEEYAGLVPKSVVVLSEVFFFLDHFPIFAPKIFPISIIWKHISHPSRKIVHSVHTTAN